MTTPNYMKNYTSYSGCDMVVTAQLSNSNKVYTLGSLQTISISTHQDKRPVRSIGNVNAKDYTMGQRTIAGSLVFAVFDKHFADQMFKDSLEEANIGSSAIILPDELPPFDITISYANEYGHTSRMALYGVRLIDEGQVASVNDIYTENTYQFVATGLEPLNKNSGTGNSSHSRNRNVIVDSNKRTIIDSDTFYNFNSNNFNATFTSNKNIELTVDVDNPYNYNDKGLVKFYLTPHQKEGYIYIGGGQLSSELAIDISLNPDAKVHFMELNIGNYYAYFKNSNGNESNKADFKVAYDYRYKSVIAKDNPIVDYVTDTSIAIYSNNIEHNKAVYIALNPMTRETEYNIVPLSARKAIFSDLTPNTQYKVFTINDINDEFVDESFLSKSSSIVIKTLKYKLEILDMFKEYLTLNNNLLSKNIEAYIDYVNEFSSAPKNMIDEILKIDFKEDLDIKNELLLFANKFQNDLIYNYNFNSSLSQPEKYIDNPLFNSFIGDQTCEHINIFKTEKNKAIFEDKLSTTNHNSYEGRYHRRYSAYSMGDNNTRSPRYDFYMFDDNDKQYLSSYINNSNELYKRDSSNIKSKYPNLSSINTYRLLALHYKTTHKCFLPAPYIEIDSENLNLEVSLNWDDLVKDNHNLKIVISDCMEALDFTPFKKINIKYIADNKYNIARSSTCLKRNKAYLIWIENSDNEIISKINSFTTCFDDSLIAIENDNINTDIKQSLCNSLEKHLLSIYKPGQELNDMFSYVLENEEVLESNIYDKIIEYVYNNINYYAGYENIVYYILKHKFMNDITIDNGFASINHTNNKLVFKSLRDFDLCITTYDNSNPASVVISKAILSDKEYEIPFSNKNTLIYLISKDKSRKSGFVFIDNKTNTIQSHDIIVNRKINNINTEVIK